MKDRCEDEIPLRRTRRQGRPRRPAEQEEPWIPRISRLVALAIKFEAMLERGEVHDYADLARLGYVTRARMTQVMNLLLLAPDIQAEILSWTSCTNGSRRLVEHELRTVARNPEWEQQRKLWRGLFGRQLPQS